MKEWTRMKLEKFMNKQEIQPILEVQNLKKINKNTIKDNHMNLKIDIVIY